MEQFRIHRGFCRPLYVFEVGFAIDLDEAARRVEAAATRPMLRHREGAAGPFEYRPAPLRINQDRAGPPLPGFDLSPAVEVVLYDFGAASLSYSIPLDGSLEDLAALSVALREDRPLLEDARRRVTELIQALGGAVQRPGVAESVEDYFCFEITAWEGATDAGPFCSRHAELIARVLRGEAGQLSPDEIADALHARLSFGRQDFTLVDWNSALIFDSEPGDLRAVLEFANVQLLELRWLDSQLDRALERAYQVLSLRAGWRSVAPGFLVEDLRQLSTLQVDSAVLLERVTNALKFLGEEYLARLYRMAAGRLHLAEWDGVITRKLATVESIYQKVTDRAATRRMELLMWMVILLIAFEIGLSLRK